MSSRGTHLGHTYCERTFSHGSCPPGCRALCRALSVAPVALRAQRSDGGAKWHLSHRYVVVEYGPMELDLNLRVRVAELEAHLAALARPGLLETSPGVRSCTIEYDQRALPLAALLELLEAADRALPLVRPVRSVTGRDRGSTGDR